MNRGRGPAGLGAGVNPGTRPDLGGAQWEPLMTSLLCLVSQLPENSNPLSLSLAWKREEGTEGRVPLKSFQTLFPGMLCGLKTSPCLVLPPYVGSSLQGPGQPNALKAVRGRMTRKQETPGRPCSDGRPRGFCVLHQRLCHGGVARGWNSLGSVDESRV